MIPGKITDLAAWRAAHARPVNEVLTWHAICERLVIAQLRILAAWQREWVRAVWRV